MLKSSKSMISTTYDQLLNIIHKIKNCYQKRQHHHHHHHFVNDLFYRCKQVKKQQRKRKVRQIKLTTNYLNTSNRSNISIDYKNINIYYNNSSNNTDLITATNSVTSLYYSSNLNQFCSGHVNKCQINYSLQHVWLDFKENFNNLKLVVVILLLALITTSAHNIDTPGKSLQIKSTTSPSPIVFATSRATVTETTTIFSKSLSNLLCSHYNSNASLRRGQPTLRFKKNIRHTFNRHRYQKCQRHLRRQASKTLSNKYHETNYLQHQNASSIIKLGKKVNFKINPIKLKNNKTKENKENLRKNKKLLTNIRTDNIINNKNNLDDGNVFNNISNETTVTVYVNKPNKINTNDDDAVYTNDYYTHHHHHHHAEINNSSMSLNLLPLPVTITTARENANDFLQLFEHTFHNKEQQQQQRDNLMRVVMDGLGLKSVPNMSTVNISQVEYITKYQEYLQRVHIRKRRELQNYLGEYDENIIRPLEIFSIESSHTLTSLRKKRNALSELNSDKEEHDENYSDEDGVEKYRNQSLEERVKNILLLKKKYQKPRSTKKEREERKTNIRLMFALKPEILNLSSSDIEEANIRLVLIHSPILAIRNSKNKKTQTKSKNNSCGLQNKGEGAKNLHQGNVLNLKLYFITRKRKGKRIWLDGQKVKINVDRTKPDETHTQWLQFDVSKAVKMTIDGKRLQHVVLDLQCDNCKRVGARILNDAYNTAADAMADDQISDGHQLMPVLNIIGHFNQPHRSIRPHKYDSHYEETATTGQRHYHHQNYNNNKNQQNRRTNCYKANQRCCRHSMDVTFKDIKGFEFIIQPKVFDAGYCHGRCPPRYNPAHHHAMLQSLIWKQNHHKAPRPCCAPSKLVELEVLHVDEKDSEKLKISTWSDMKVVECACS